MYFSFVFFISWKVAVLEIQDCFLTATICLMTCKNLCINVFFIMQNEAKEDKGG